MEKELNLGNQISKYYKSFSGTDTLAFIMMPGSNPVIIGSLTTISYSMYRNKKPVINIGRTNINGVTRGSRIFAGTMIFTLINQHWLKELQSQLDWLKGFKELKVDELPLFDIMIVSANEYGNFVTMYIYGIDFTDEAQTISVEDLFTENTFSFVARDVSTFKAGSIEVSETHKSNDGNNQDDNFSQKFYILDSSVTDFTDLTKLERELSLSKISQLKDKHKYYTLPRNLYYSSSKTMIGNDVSKVQELLNKTKLMDIQINGIFDEITDKAVRVFQSFIKDTVDGVVDDKLYNALMNNVNINDTVLGVVVNKYGAYVYKNADYNSDIVDTKQYREQVVIHDLVVNDDEQFFRKWYKTDNGYIAEEDLYSSYYTGNIIEFPKIQYGDMGAYVTMIQSALSCIYSEYTSISSSYDYITQKYVKKLQEDYGLVVSGIVDNDTWLLLQSLAGNIASQLSNDNFKLDFKTLPGIYNISAKDIIEKLDLFDVSVSCDNTVNVKFTAISIFDDENSETFTMTLPIKEEQVVKLKELSNAFIYNIKQGKIPKQVDYIIYPFNKKPFKWTIIQE